VSLARVHWGAIAGITSRRLLNANHPSSEQSSTIWFTSRSMLTRRSSATPTGTSRHCGPGGPAGRAPWLLSQHGRCSGVTFPVGPLSQGHGARHELPVDGGRRSGAQVRDRRGCGRRWWRPTEHDPRSRCTGEMSTRSAACPQGHDLGRHHGKIGEPEPAAAIASSLHGDARRPCRGATTAIETLS